MEKNCYVYFLKSIIIMLALALHLFAEAQSYVVKGSVFDVNNETLTGVTVMEVGTNNATITNVDGEYTLRLKSTTATLSFSYTGMATHREPVGGRSLINVVLHDASHSLDEVVVIGYGNVKRSDLTASVSSIGRDAMENRIVTSLEDAMKGKAAGLQIVQNDGAPGSDFTMRIRGASSINASSAPIFVIDGVITETAVDLNPGDVESIEILKDASGTAIYGSRGANGVIIVTTKKGQDGKVKLDLYANIGLQAPAGKYHLMDAAQYARMRYQATGWKYYKYGTDPATFPSDASVYRDGTGSDANYWLLSDNNIFRDWLSYGNSTNTDWQDVMFRTALIREYRVNLSGGSADTKYAFMGGYLNQDGIVVNSAYERFSGRIKLDQKLSKSLQLMANIAATKGKYDGLATGSSDGLITSLLRQRPTLGNYENAIADEELSGGIISNPFVQARDIVRDRYRNNLSVRLQLDYTINKAFLFRTTGAYVNNNDKDKLFYPANTSQGFKTNGRAVVADSENTRLTGEAFLYYTRKFGKNNRLKLMSGATVETSDKESLNTENQYFPTLNLGVNSLQQGINPQVPTTTITPIRMISFLGRAEYALKDRYLVTGTIRRDGSSRFGAGNKWATFPSIAFGWRISDEDIIRQMHLFDNLKLRISAGRSGNTAIPVYRSISTVATAFHPMNGENINYGVVIERTDNKDLKWETTDQYDAGLDFAFFNHALRITADVYLKKTNDLLLEKNAPYYTGYEKGWANIGSVQNKGLEITLGATPVSNKNLRWELDFNIAFNRSKVLHIGPGGQMGFDPGVIPGSGNFVMIREGESIGQWYGYKVDGVYRSQQEIDSHGLTELLGTSGANLALQPGDHKFVDQNGDKKINSDDLVVLGRGEPLAMGGLSTTLHCRGIELSVVWQYSYGAKVFNANLATLDSGRDAYNQTSHIANCWLPTLYDEHGTIVDPGNPNGTSRMPGRGAENYCLSNFIEDGSFVRLSDITLSYTFKKRFLHQLNIQHLKVFLTGKNLYLLSSYSGYDPEVNTRQGQTGDLMPSLDFSAYPRSQAFSAGFNISF
jgi:TonB-linked SusC/RagA family outer membrane protein